MSDAASGSRPRRAPKDARRVRLATPDDGPELCRLFAEVAMESDLQVAVERDPDFFALYGIQQAESETHAAEVEGRLEGLGTLLFRPGWVEGELRPVSYAGDLRLSPRIASGFFLGRMFGPRYEEALAARGCELSYTAIIAANEAATRSLVRRSRRFPRKPVYRPWREFTILTVHFTRRRRPRPTDLEVRRASEADLPEVAARLAEDHRGRPFGYPFDEAFLRERIRRWPGLAPERFVLARRGGELVGVAADWDGHAIKRYRVTAYRGKMVWVRRAFNLGALLLRYPPLPAPGGDLRYAYLTHVSVKDDDPAVMAALLDRVYADLHGRGYHFLFACLYADDPLWPAYRRYLTTPVPARLFTVSPAGSRWNDWDPGPARPGFEMALV